MPRGFRAEERRHIRGQLVEAGQRALGAGGVRKTTVADLAHAAGISKGAFYLFFASKEELFLTLLAEAEQALQSELLAAVRQSDAPPRERMRAALRAAASLWRQRPSLGQLREDDVAALGRAAPADLQRANDERDERFAAELLALVSAGGPAPACAPATLAAALRALFFVSLSAAPIGPHYPAALDLLIDGLAHQIIPEEPAR